MPSRPKQKKLDEAVQKLVRIVFDAIDPAIGDWEQATADIRAPANGLSCVSTLRIRLKNGKLVEDQSVPGDASRFVLKEMWTLRGGAKDKKWYGIRLIIAPAELRGQFNFDEDCINDPSFYDVDL